MTTGKALQYSNATLRAKLRVFRLKIKEKSDSQVGFPQEATKNDRFTALLIGILIKLDLQKSSFRLTT